jgi:hypothetical protein
MFNLNYKIFNDLDDELENNEFYGEFGYFQISVGHSEYGIYLDKEVEAFSVSIYWWIRYFMEATIKLRKESTVCISDIETPKIWIELKKIDNHVMTISKIEAKKTEGTSAIVLENQIRNKIVNWQEATNISEYQSEIIDTCEKYLDDLIHLNGQGNVYINELRDLLKKVQELPVQ